jgi:DNA invertase Pin-like site-specific DNA recombinase
MAVYSYTRVSTTAQAEEGESLGAQQRRVEGYGMQHDLTVDRHFVERGRFRLGAARRAAGGQDAARDPQAPAT